MSGRREQLAAALAEVEVGPEDGPGWNNVMAERLLPTVDRIVAEAVAAELRAAADELVRGLGVGSYNPASPYVGAVRDSLRARADAFGPATATGRDEKGAHDAARGPWGTETGASGQRGRAERDRDSVTAETMGEAGR